MDKYLFDRPTYRLLAERRTLDLDVSLGTITDGRQRLVPLVEPIYEALAAHSRCQPLGHGDQTRGQVFATVEGTVGGRWYLEVVPSADVVVVILAAGRARDAPEEYFGADADGILVVDRDKANQVMDQVKQGLLILAFCWAHVRRDFRTVARTWPDPEGWAFSWVERLGELDRLNDACLAVRQEATAFARADAPLRVAVTALGEQGERELADRAVHPARRKVLASLGYHWTGLTLFVDHPEVPMDRQRCGPVGAIVFSLLQTLCLWRINPRTWLTTYLAACAEAGGQAPADVDAFLPWNVGEDQFRSWSLRGSPPAADTS